MTDLITRLRTWSHARHAAPASDLMDEAADEIEALLKRLQSDDSGYTSGVSSRSDLKPASRTGSNSRQTCDEAAECHSLGMECPEREQVANHQANLYSSTLTDAEREAVEWFARHSNHGMSMRRAATLRGLLERLGGDR